jgi:micrococcal nuclease
MYEYKCKVLRVVDGDTVDIDVDLGFGVILSNERVRLCGIDTPESRTSDPVEKIFGFAAKRRLIELLQDQEVVLLSSEFKGKFGRILGDFKVLDVKITDILLYEHHAALYDGQSKEEIKEEHLANREILMNDGTVSALLVDSVKTETA